MEINIEIDTSAWESALDRWIVLARAASRDASLEGAETIQKVTRARLLSLGHAAHTHTPSPPGGPPAAITGILAASVETRMDGDWALVGPTAAASSDRGPYGRFLELGGTHEASGLSGRMTWLEDGRWWSRVLIEKGPRPYLKPSTDEVVDSGDLLRIYADHWARAQAEAA